MKSRFYLVYKLRYKYFRFGGRHLGFPTSGYADSINISFFEFLDPENMGVANEIASLSSLQAEI